MSFAVLQAAGGFGAVTTTMFTGRSVEECKQKAPNCTINPEFLVGNTDIACQCAVAVQAPQAPVATKPYYPPVVQTTSGSQAPVKSSGGLSFGPVTWALVIGAVAVGVSFLFKKKR